MQKYAENLESRKVNMMEIQETSSQSACRYTPIIDGFGFDVWLIQRTIYGSSEEIPDRPVRFWRAGKMADSEQISKAEKKNTEC